MGDMTAQQRSFIGDIFSSGKHLLSLINDILDLSKVEAGKMTLDLEPVDVRSLISNSLSIIREKAAARHVRVSMDSVGELATIQVDARKLKQIVYNLLSNAVKFTGEGGSVTVRASIVRRADVNLVMNAWAARSPPPVVAEFEQFLRLSVTDSGIGVSPDGLRKLFQPFSQIEGGLARRFEGTGLGLAMVKQLSELHGGAVAVESTEGEGSCFTVWLPLRPTAGAAASAPSAKAVLPSVAPSTGAPTALVVEDDLKSAELIRVQLEAEGFRVLHAASAERALEMAAEQPLSLITLDIMLPMMDGWEFLSRIKQFPALARIPIVIISIIADRSKGFALGAAAVMQKPISRKDLVDSLRDLGLFPPQSGHSLHVLVVDDDPKSIELIATRLQGLADVVDRATGGRQAIEMAKQQPPDLVVLDLMMPEVNGFEVVEALRAYPPTASLPILVVTAMDVSPPDRARLNGYVTAIVAKTELGLQQFNAEVRRAMAGRQKNR